MIDLLERSIVTHNDTRYAEDTETDYGSDNTETIDNDTNTYYGVQSYHAGDGNTSCYVQSEHTWDEAVHVAQFVTNGKMQYKAGNYFNGDMDVEVSLKISGTWTKIVDAHWDNSPSGSGTWGTREFEYDEDNSGAGWDDVTGIRVYVYTYAYSYEGTRYQYTRAYINEVSCNTTVPSRSFRLAKQVLGKMNDWNSGLTSSTYNGIYESVITELNASSFVDMKWNELTGDEYDVEFFTSAGSSAAALAYTTGATMSGAYLTKASHGLSVDDYIRISGASLPTNVDSAKMYQVVTVSGSTISIDEPTATGSASDVLFKQWDGPLSNPNSSTLLSDPDDFFQLLIALSSDDSTNYMPRVYFTGGYLAKLTYMRGASDAESAVEFIYEFGFRNFNTPMAEKFFRSFASLHEGTYGSYRVIWEIHDFDGEKQTGYFDIDLSANPRKYISMFPDTAVGYDLNIKIYKNDNQDFKLKEVQGAYDVMETSML